MRLDFSTKLLDLKGLPIKDGKDGPEITLGTAAAAALLQRFPEEQNLSGDDSAKRFKLALLICEAAEAEVTVEQAADIKRVVAKAYTPLIVGRVFEIIEAAKSAD